MSKFRELFESVLAEFNLLSEATAADTLKRLAINKLKETYGNKIIIDDQTSGTGDNGVEHNSQYFDLVVLSKEPELGLEEMPTSIRYRFSNHPKPDKPKSNNKNHIKTKDEERKPVDIFVPDKYFLDKYHEPFKHVGNIPFYHINMQPNFTNAYMKLMLAKTDKLLPKKHDETKNKLKVIKDNKNKILQEIKDNVPEDDNHEELKFYYDFYNDGNNKWFNEWFENIGKEPAQDKIDKFKQAAADIKNKTDQDNDAEKRPTLTLGTFKTNER